MNILMTRTAKPDDIKPMFFGITFPMVSINSCGGSALRARCGSLDFPTFDLAVQKVFGFHPFWILLSVFLMALFGNGFSALLN